MKTIIFQSSVLFFVLIAAARPPQALATPGIAPATCAEVYIVQVNDWLSKIANKFLGDDTAYPAIIEATNRLYEQDKSYARISNPDEIEAGWKICIPVNEEAENFLAAIPPARPAAPTITADSVYSLERFVQEHRFSPEVDPAWIYTTPPPLEQFEILPEHQQGLAYGYRANYLWNEHLSNDYFLYSDIFKAIPAQVRLYEAPWQTVYPRYRYPPNVTLPTGLTTNQFGWRGPQISLKKPDRTIRIACVGASTTVGIHAHPFSYPEFLQHWLNLWSQAQGYGVNFEVINAGREGLGSRDIAAVVRYEILPLDVDYVIYYEGSNQFNPQSMVSFPADVTFGQPPPGVAPNLANVESDDKTLLDRLSEYSALAARARSIVEQFSLTGLEPPKPEQTFHLPEGLDEFRPDRADLGQALSLQKILADLDQIKQELAEHEVKMVLATFDWFVYEGMALDPARHRALYTYLNRLYWPISYANMRRMADLQNRVLQGWAAAGQMPLIDVAGLMPRQPDLYDDAIHNTYLGTRIRAWINFEAMLSLLKADIEAGDLPRPARLNYKEHPYIKPGDQVRVLTE
jgi:hypothetical protein